jgi:methionyl aminopeptidase
MVKQSKSNKLPNMRAAGKIVAETLLKMKEASIPGNTTGHLNDLAKSIIDNTKYVKSSFYGYKGFPAYVCTSINQEVVHGIPSFDKELMEGDILSLDFAVSYKGYHADSCITIPIGNIDDRKQRLLAAGRNVLSSSMAVARVGRYVGDISYTIQSLLSDYKCVPVIEFSGHGIGRSMHESPQIPNFGVCETGTELYEGMTIAIEPVIAEGKYILSRDVDGWTVRTTNGILTAHFEHTILITSNGIEILTKI